ncbi:MAG TPA: VWA domain-containing protein, partial [Anaerolineales bacterium]|nr:VWA domain-containing protein [Anaerolineales bacterium]
DLGLQVDPHRARLFAQALAQVGVAERSDFYFAARSCLIYRQQDLADFDRAFEAFWRSRFRGGIPLTLPARPRRRAAESGSAESKVPSAGIESEPAQSLGPLAYSAAEALRRKDFSELTAEELDQVKRLMRKTAWRLGLHPGRRQRAGKGRLPDYRRTLRSSLRYGGEPLVWALRQPRPKYRPLVVLADVSGSMEPYSRMLLQFLYGLANGLDQPPEIFVFSTRLSRITRALQSQDAEQALRGVVQEVLDWSGGTRIGEALRQFNLHWARRVLFRGTVVAIISDGLDRGQTELLRSEVARLQRSCWRLMWLNPLLGSLDYEPLAQGMRAALPFVDDFLPVNNLARLEELALQLRGVTAGPRPRRGGVGLHPGRLVDLRAGESA